MLLVTVFRNAVVNGRSEMAEYLLSLGAPLTVDGGYGWYYKNIYNQEETALSYACRSGSEATVKLLLQHGAKPILYHGPKWTSNDLSIAVQKGNLGIVKTLVRAGAPLNAGDNPPIISAIMLEYTEMFNYLMNRGAQLRGREIGTLAAKMARDAGLESRLELVSQHVTPAQLEVQKKERVGKNQEGIEASAS